MCRAREGPNGREAHLLRMSLGRPSHAGTLVTAKKTRAKSPAKRARTPRTTQRMASPKTSSALGQLSEYRRKRDFTKTAEPKGGRAKSSSTLRFVIQKHAATRLHFDLRLELDGVMKSWAVPKGPSVDPAEKRLAMQVEDHPIEYNTFEGIIPEGEYGGGTVMLWDRGTYTYPGNGSDAVERLRQGLAKGDFKFELHGKRLRGSWVLVRMRGDEYGKTPWLLIKHRDEYAKPGFDIVASEQTSIATRRTMDAIAKGRSRVWRSNR
ncbi:MAG TPA: DNA polymerase ligase N-terminal domain-containing protein [Gemmatimonadaceae bacterium]|nr:DNA polymerase ligase N-terminal domain-containing protein [Gemmatimonadaceae bacterium]